MGYYVELRAQPGEVLAADEIRRRLLTAGGVIHPDDGDSDFLFEFGIVTLNPPEKIKAGNWAWVRMSWAAESTDLKRLIELAERIGTRIYDASISSYVTTENFDSVYDVFRRNAEHVIKTLGMVEASGTSTKAYHRRGTKAPKA